PFVHINCSAVPESLLESELFGYEEGSFTGAKKGGKKGLFEIANNGIIFLDEIAEMPLQVQAKLLNVLQENELYRIGSSYPVKINTRVLAATNKDLYKLVKDGKFREDLFYRLNVIPITIPPLRVELKIFQ
ncbi:MAG: sigma 54-interacting transcriptional regulator, partial [Bacillota bacterium]